MNCQGRMPHCEPLPQDTCAAHCRIPIQDMKVESCSIPFHIILPDSSMRACKRPVRVKHLISLVWLEEM